MRVQLRSLEGVKPEVCVCVPVCGEGGGEGVW